jgi:segregation and condensation protein B
MAKKKNSDATEPKNDSVAFVSDPFALSVNEVRDAQNDDDELELDQDLQEVNEELERAAAELPAEDMPEDKSEILDASASDEEMLKLAQAMAAQTAEYQTEIERLVEGEKEDAEARLAAEIAEDQALEKALAEQAEQEDETDPELKAALPALPVADENGNLDLSEVESCLEALLFMTDKPMSTAKLRELLGPEFPHSIFQEAITSLRDRYKAIRHGIELVEVAGGFQFRTKPGRAALARKLAKVQTQRLSSGAMETLAIVAYRQPVMKEDIDKVRGVDSSHFIRGLLDKKLIKIAGRSELPGRPMLYSTSQEFLELFGLKDLSAMPSLRELEQMVPASQSGNPEDEDPRVKEMRRLVSQMKTDSTNLSYDPKEDEKILSQIKERVSSIPTSSPYLDAQKAAEKLAREAAANPETAPRDGKQLEIPAEATDASLAAQNAPAADAPSDHSSA